MRSSPAPALRTLALFSVAVLTPLALLAAGGRSPSGGKPLPPLGAADPEGAAVAAPRVEHDPGIEPLRAATASLTGAEAPFTVELDGEPVPLRLTALPILPGHEVHIAAPGVAGARLVHQAGSALEEGDGSWRWRAPDASGAYALEVAAGREVMHLTALVLHPADRVRGGRLGDYAIGEYVQTPLRGDPAYLPPPGFVEVGEADADLLVSPRLTLGQFLCKQPGDPRYLAVSPPLLVKLEAILDRIDANGWDPASLVVMSGFRTPAYNRAIGNTTVYSRHLWGDAADIYLDGDGDGVMDDLDGDGRTGEGDAHQLARWVEEVMVERDDLRPGGLATYRANAVHGPFVHVDARGHRARW